MYSEKERKMANAIKRNPEIQALIACKLISLSREQAVLAKQLREVAVPANLGQLKNQQGAGRDSPAVKTCTSRSPLRESAVLAY
jgi:hypothetical protein